MREAHISDGKQRVARLHRGHPNLTGSHKHMTRDDLFNDGHRPCFSLNWRRYYFASQARFVVVEQSAVFDNVSRDWIKTIGELSQRYLGAGANAFHQTQVRGGKQPDVLRV